ncbi:MAG: hypothetical protein JJE40_20385 [Vicinamibacteria bacterium]|nr:hypothetical protein [Vicinamibacteria bacterium]
MPLRAIAASGLLAAALVAPALADGGKAPVRVSAEVVRSCRVKTDQTQVSVTCGASPQPVRVSYAGGGSAEPLVAAHPAVAPVSATSVTIHF